MSSQATSRPQAPDREQSLADRELDRRRLARLSALFGPLDVETFEELESEVEWRTLESGHTLFRQGDAADAAYVIVSGRLRVAIATPEGGERVINEMGPGEPVGEMALLDGGERSATVYAVRDSELARIARPAFDRLVAEHPRWMRRISRIIVQRLQRQTAQVHPPHALSTIALLPAGPGIELAGFARDLERALTAHGSCLRLTGGRVGLALAEPGIAGSSASEAGHARLAEWMAEQEAGHRFVVYQADASAGGWSDRCVRHADHVLIVADADADPAPGELERRLAARERPPRSSLVLLQRGEPGGTARWLAERAVEAHYHVRAGHGGDVERLARLLTGNAVGLVLGGGGARGLAHLGVLRALDELGIRVDMVGGTSMGSLVAGLVAMGKDAGETRRDFASACASLKDFTFPMVALLEGRKIARRCRAIFGERRIEDLEIPFFAVSTNLTRAEQMIHRTGRIFDAVRASIALPGILPPARQGDDLLIDGGLLNNVPVDVMRELPGGVRVIAVDVSEEVELVADPRLGTEASGWKLLWNRLNPWARRLETPGICSLLQRATLVGSVAARKRTKALADVYLEPPASEWGLLEFDALDAIAERGYSSAIGPLSAWRDAAPASV